MSSHITIIDVELGNQKEGFAIRVGKEHSPLYRLANCIAWDTENNQVGWSDSATLALAFPPGQV